MRSIAAVSVCVGMAGMARHAIPSEAYAHALDSCSKRERGNGKARDFRTISRPMSLFITSLRISFVINTGSRHARLFPPVCSE